MCNAVSTPRYTLLLLGGGDVNIFSGDDQSVSIQMRGGPGPLMVTSWAQIMSLDPSYIGKYHCIASNTEGSVYAFASVGVYKGDL